MPVPSVAEPFFPPIRWGQCRFGRSPAWSAMATASGDSDHWRSVEFFYDVIGRDLLLPRDAFRVQSVHVADANSFTAGYMSLIHRVTVDVQLLEPERTTVVTYVVKEKSDKVFGGEFVDLFHAFAKEIEIYERILPVFEELWCAEGVKFGPRIFKAQQSEAGETLIVMEDLKRLNFSMRDKQAGLNWSDTRNVLTKLAKFHAASVVYRVKRGPYAGHFDHGMLALDAASELHDYQETLFASFIDSLQERGAPTEILSIVSKLQGHIYETCCEAFRFNVQDFNVLNQGDIWTNNLMFNDDDFVFLDYQIAFYGSVSFDLIYFALNSAIYEVVADLDRIIDHYHQSLVSSLAQLHHDGPLPSRDALMEELKRHGVLILLQLSETIPIVLSEVTETSDMLDLTKDDQEGAAKRRLNFHNPKYTAVCDSLLRMFFDRGFFDHIPSI